MKFTDIIGQDNVKQHLRQMYETNRMPHALLLLGTEGCGALPLAYALSQFILCTGDKSSGEPCGTCPACIKAAALVHPDVHSIFPSIRRNSDTTCETFLPQWRNQLTSQPYFGLSEWSAAMRGQKNVDDDDESDSDTPTKASADNKQAQILKDAGSAIHTKLSMKPYEARHQFMIIWKPELMNEVTANSILKILEEPPLDTSFILVSEDTQRILPTILSRTQRVVVPPLTEADIASYISAHYERTTSEAQRIAHIAQGNLAAAIRLVEGGNERSLALDFFKNVMRAAWKRDVKALADTAEDLKKLSREQVKNVLMHCRALLRESFVMNLSTPQLNYISAEEEEFLARFAPFVHINNIELLTSHIDKTISMVEQNGNIKMVVLDLVLSLTAYIRNTQRPEVGA